MTKDTFILRTKYKKPVEKLSDEEAGMLFKAIFCHEAGEPAGDLPPLADMLYLMISEELEKDREHYEAMCEQNRENGRKGGKAKATATDRHRVPPTATECKPNDIDNDIESDIENDNDVMINHRSETEEIIKAWNDNSNLENIALTAQNARRVFELMKSHSKAEIIEAIRKIKESDYLQGLTAQSMAVKFLWFTNLRNFEKVLADDYKNRPRRDLYASINKSFDNNGESDLWS